LGIKKGKKKKNGRLPFFAIFPFSFFVMRVFIKTYGCQMNVADSLRMEEVLLKDGYSITQSEDDADIILLNTCSVRKSAEQKVWSKIGELKNKKVIIGVTGCMAQEHGKKIFHRAPNVKLVCGTYRENKISELVSRAVKEGKTIDIAIEECAESPGNGKHKSTTNICAFVPISRGCNNACSYCIVPSVRGPERNRPAENIIDEIRYLGCKDATLLGQNVNSYKDGQIDFVGLLGMVNEIDGLLRVRFVTSHPKDAGEELFKAIRYLDKVCEYLHIPIQSGSNRILGKMNRKYTREHYLGLIKKARQYAPDIAISTDLIVGFPGETEEDFQDTLDLVMEVRYDSAYIFKYSPREGTAAFELADDVPTDVKQDRNQRLLRLQEEISLSKNRELVGRIVEVLVEDVSKENKDRLMGRTRTNKIVVFPLKDGLIGNLVNVEIKEATAHTLYGI